MLQTLKCGSVDIKAFHQQFRRRVADDNAVVTANGDLKCFVALLP
jgi:hypothetical protein